MIDFLESMAVASVAVTARALAEMAGSEVTFLGWRSLVVVGAAHDSIRLSELADRLGLSRPSASKLVRRMARRQLLELEPDPADGRGLRLRLAGEGSRLRSAVVEKRRQLLLETLAGLGEDPADESARAFLAEMAGRLDQWA